MLDHHGKVFCLLQLQVLLFDSPASRQTITQQRRSPATFGYHLGFLAGVIYYFNIESVKECEVLDTSEKKNLRASARVFLCLCLSALAS